MIPSGDINKDFEQNIGLIHKVSKKGYGWAQSLRLPLDYDDIFQEASLVFVKACEGFDVNAGLQFSTYFTTAAMNQFGRTIGVMTGCKHMNKREREKLAENKMERKRRAEAGEAPLIGEDYFGLSVTNFSDMETEEEDDISESFVSGMRTPEQIVAAREEWAVIQGGMSSLAYLISSWLLDPPEELVRELEASRAHAEFAHSIGMEARANQDVSISTICDFLIRVSGHPRSAVVAARRELSRAIERVSE